MPQLFETRELVSLMQREEFDTDTAELIRELVTIEIRNAVGPTDYDAMTDVSQFKGIALSVAKRAAGNPEGLRSRQRSIDDYSETETYASETLVDVELTELEFGRIDRILGRSTGAFTIRPAGIPDHRARRWPSAYCD